MSNPVKHACDTSAQEEVSPYGPHNPIWREGYADGLVAVRQSTPNLRNGYSHSIIYTHGWLAGRIKAQSSSPLQRLTAGTVH